LKRRGRFVRDLFDGLLGTLRPHSPRTVDNAQAAAVIGALVNRRGCDVEDRLLLAINDRDDYPIPIG
jgi:hypothetical protein